MLEIVTNDKNLNQKGEVAICTEVWLSEYALPPLLPRWKGHSWGLCSDMKVLRLRSHMSFSCQDHDGKGGLRVDQHSTLYTLSPLCCKIKPQHLPPRALGTDENVQGVCCAEPGMRDLVKWFTLEPQSTSSLSIPSLVSNDALGTLILKNTMQSVASQIWIMCGPLDDCFKVHFGIHLTMEGEWIHVSHKVLQCTEQNPAHCSAKDSGVSWSCVARGSALVFFSLPERELPGNADNELSDWVVTCFLSQP